MSDSKSTNLFRTDWLVELGILRRQEPGSEFVELTPDLLQKDCDDHKSRGRPTKANDRVAKFISANSQAIILEPLGELDQLGEFGRLLIWPRGKPAGDRRLVGLVASRLGRKLDERDDWFRRLRLACAAAQRENAAFVTAQDSAGYEFISRSAELFGIPVVRIVSNERVSAARWLEWVIDQCDETSESNDVWPVFVSPRVTSKVSDESMSNAVESESLIHDSTPLPHPPIQDRVVSKLSDQLWVMSLRRNGNWHRLIETRLHDLSRPSGNVRLIDGDVSLSEPFAQELHANGAVRWCLTETEDRIQQPPTEQAPQVDRPAKSDSCTATSEFLARLKSGKEFLTHWTRRSAGPWPGESEAEFLDGYILSESPDRSALGTLSQILRDGVLRASDVGIRSNQPVISFTAVPLTELIGRRHFQTHRRRWDFEHYGLCISRDVLATTLGTRPAIYGDDEAWSKLAPEDQPLFQKARSESESAGGGIDWTQEKEWRRVGDIELAKLPPDQWFVFAATTNEAQQLSGELGLRVVSIEELRAATG